MEIGLTVLFVIIILTSWYWTRGRRDQALAAPEFAGRYFFLGTSLGAIALSSIGMVFLFGVHPVDAVLLSSSITLILTFGARKSLSRAGKR